MAAHRVLLRAADGHDLQEILRIERSVFGDPWGKASFLSAIEHSRMRTVVAEEAGRVVGYSVCVFAADEGELANIAVATEHRNKGFGALLLEDALLEGWKRGASQFFLEVRQSNAGARRLYEKAGFRELMRRPRYYSGPVEDAIVMILRRSDHRRIT